MRCGRGRPCSGGSAPSERAVARGRSRRGQPALAVLGALAALAVLAGCGLLRDAGSHALSSEPYRPDRRDYRAFAAAHPDLLEPNYLPFMVHRLRGDDASGDPLIFCRWPQSRMPLAVAIEEPEIPESLQDEFFPASPQAYGWAVSRALDTWEQELEGLVRFRRVDDPSAAALRLRILGEEAPAPEPDVRVLGSTEKLLQACRPLGWDAEADRMRVDFDVPELLVYMADRFGPLTPHQVETIALHEIGHALGMRGHSPIPSDLMYPVLQDRPSVERLSAQDVNSFVSLYRLPNGARFGSVPIGASEPPPPALPPPGPPNLAMAPHVDANLGFSVRQPTGWTRISDPHGFFSANGPTWDHEASFEVFVWPSPTLEDFLARYGGNLFAETWLRYRAPLVVHGRRALEIVVESADGRVDMDFILIEIGDGRVMLFLAESPTEVAEAWRPWFRAVLATLEIWEPKSG